MYLKIGEIDYGDISSDVVITSKEGDISIIKPTDWVLYNIHSHRVKKVEIDGKQIWPNMTVLKVVVKEGFERAFEDYCQEKGIYYKAYPLEILKTRYRVECELTQLIGASRCIVSIREMPKVGLD